MQGVQQMTAQQLEQLLNRLIDARHADFIAAQLTPAATSTTVSSNVDEAGYKYWVWGGKFRPVPPEWSMPSGKVKTIMDLFITGDNEASIRPFMLIKGNELKKTDQKAFYKAQCLFEKLLAIGVEHNVYNGTAKELTIQQWDSLFMFSMGKIIDYSYP